MKISGSITAITLGPKTGVTISPPGSIGALLPLPS